MQIPGSWIAQGIAGSGVVWVRKQIEIPDHWIGKELCLTLGGIDKQDITYWNGEEIGRTGKALEKKYFETKRSYVIPEKLVKQRKNTIAIRAFSFYYDGAFTNAERYYRLICKETQEKIDLSGEWNAKAEEDRGHVIPPVITNWGAGNPNTPTILFDSMIRPLLKFGIQGVIWYQGESNASSIVQSIQYQRKLQLMIEHWRTYWEQGNFPFLQVQLANFRVRNSFDEKSNWAFLRESQRKVCETCADTFMASAIDIGDPQDIHPFNKKSVGIRLAMCALYHVYGKKEVVPAGPMFKTCRIEKNRIYLTFENAKGMYFKGGDAQGFFVADVQKEFHKATRVWIEGNQLVVECSQVANPVAVRYAWSDNPDGNLYNGANLPASSFRTDAF